MDAIGAQYARFIEHDTKAAQEAGQIVRLFHRTNYAIYRLIAESDPDQIQQAGVEFETAVSALRQTFHTLNDRAPELASQIKAVQTQVERYISDMSEARTLGEANLNADALTLMHEKIDPAYAALSRGTGALALGISNRMDAGTRDLSEQIEATRRDLWTFTGIGLLAGLATATVVGVYGIGRPLNRLVASLERMAEGDTEAEIAGGRRSDEIGAVARAVDGIRALVARKAAAEAESRRAVDAAAAIERHRAMSALADTFEATVGGIVGTVSQAAAALRATASAMTVSARDTADRSTAVADTAEETARTVNTVAAAAEQLGTSAIEIGRRADDSARLTETAVTEAEQGRGQIGALNTAVTEIADVVSLIAQIAGQTNLLALNATIEAARAGEAGAGFAVVASEVKALATQTARATETIGQRIALVQGSTDRAVQTIHTIGGRIREVSAVTAAMAGAITQQGAASREIVRGIAQAAAGTDAVTRTIAGVAEAAGATGAAAGQVLGSADALAEQSEALRGEVGRFLATVRAG